MLAAGAVPPRPGVRYKTLNGFGGISFTPSLQGEFFQVCRRSFIQRAHAPYRVNAGADAAQSGPHPLYKYSKGVSGVVANSSGLTVADLSYFSVGAVFSGAGAVSRFLSFSHQFWAGCIAPACIFSCPVKRDACTGLHEVKYTVLYFGLSQRLPEDSTAFSASQSALSFLRNWMRPTRCEGLRFVHPFRQLRIIFRARAETRTRQKYAANSVTVYHARHPSSLPIRPSFCGALVDIQHDCMQRGLDCLEHGQVGGQSHSGWG